MASGLTGASVAFLIAAEGTEKAELVKPWERVEAEGGRPVLVSPAEGEAALFDHLDRAGTKPVDVNVSSASAQDYAGLVLPGGVANPDQLRTNPDAVEFVKAFFSAGKPVAVICHGPWTLVEAGVVRGRTLTSWPSLRTDITNAGGTWVDETVVIDDSGPNVLISSRKPDDLPDFCDAISKVFGTGR